MKSPLVQLGDFIATERGFMRASTLGLGVPAAVLGAWYFSRFGELASLLIVPISFAAAYAWGYFMWRAMFRDFARRRAMADQVPPPGPPERRAPP